MNSALKTRAKLSEAQAIAIFQIKKSSPSPSAAETAKLFCISEKAVRDIWSGRTWTKETWHLDTSRILSQKNVGRPKGCKDSKPRETKTYTKQQHQITSYIDSEGPVSAAKEIGLKAPGTKAAASSAVRKMPSVQPAISLQLASANMQSVSYRPRRALPTQLPTSPRGAASVDQQLHEWGQIFWIEDERADPFQTDWRQLQQRDGSSSSCSQPGA